MGIIQLFMFLIFIFSIFCWQKSRWYNIYLSLI